MIFLVPSAEPVPVASGNRYGPRGSARASRTEINVRRTLRRLVIAAGAAMTLVVLSTPAHAASSVRAQWQMDKLPTMVDSAGGDNNGTTRNITLSGGAYKFNGTSSEATAPDKSNLDPGTAGARLTAKISMTKVPQSGQTFDVVRKGLTTSSGGYYKMEIRRSTSGAAVAACVFKDGSGRVGEAVGTTNLANKGFVTVTCRKTTSGVTMTAAGQTKTISMTLGSISNSAAVYVGGKGDGTDWFPGLMDSVKIEIG
jgi:hypothetical protein